MPADLAPVDTDVAVPPSVKRAAKRAEAIHKAAYNTEAPPESPPADPLITIEETPPAPVIETPPPAPEPVAAIEPLPPSTPEQRKSAPAGSWEQQYYGMEGRWKQSQITIGSMQQQMQELGDEIIRLQQTLAQPVRQNAPAQQPQQYVTPEEVQSYGPDFVDMVKRAAREAIAPDLQSIEHRTQQVSQRVQQNSAQGIYATLEQHIPNWKEINVDPRFKSWCRSQDVYSRQVRGKLLNDAFQAADAPRVVAFFQGFLNEEAATGQAPSPRQEPQLAPRTAAVNLETLASPGRAKPATGNTALPADKPVFTRAQVSGFYDAVRKGAYTGRDTDKARDEAAIFSAQNEGRIRG